MRKLVLFFPFLLLGCGGSTADDCACTDGGSDATLDVAKQNDAAACTSPAQCQGAAPICCGTVVLSGGTAPNCTTSSITSVCAAQCTTAFVSDCNGPETVRLCAQASDCAGDPTNDKCCTFASGSQSLTFCASQGIATGAGATCK